MVLMLSLVLVNLLVGSDVDLNDAKVQQMYATYSCRLGFVSELGLTRRECHEVEEDLLETEEAHKDDFPSFVMVGVSRKLCTYLHYRCLKYFLPCICSFG